MEFILTRSSGSGDLENPDTVEIGTLEELLEFINNLDDYDPHGQPVRQIVLGHWWYDETRWRIEIYNTWRE